MKKYNLYLWLIALVGLFASCSQDETADALQYADNKTVSITASLPDDFAQIGTRALPTVTDHGLRCILEVWTLDAIPVLKYREERNNVTGENLKFEFTIDDGTYNCLIWADFIATDAAETNVTIGDVTYKHYADKYYTTNTADGLRAISIIDAAYAGGFNTEARDAFFRKDEFTKQAGQNKSFGADLVRPFAKLIIKEKTTEAYALCKTMTATYTVPKTFNVLTGTASGSYTANYNAAPAGNGNADLTLFSDLIFTTSYTQETLGEISLTFTRQDVASKDLLPVTIPAGVPVQRNIRTNAAGNLISVEPDPTNKAIVTVDMNTKWTPSDDNVDLDATVWDGTYPTSEAQAKEWLGTESAGTNAADGIDHVFTITAARQLAALQYLIVNDVAMANAESNSRYEKASYKLAADIDLNNHPWTPIGYGNTITPYSGIFDGQGHTIRGMNITGNYQYNGFFAIVEGVVKHLNVKGTVASSRTDGIVSSGGIAGKVDQGTNASCIAFCSFEGTIASASVFTDNAGGIAGQLGAGKILSCYTVVTAMDLTGSGGTHNKGGIAGKVDNYSVIKGCYWKTLTGVNSHYGSGTLSDTQGIGDSFADAAAANAAVDAMNTATPTGYDYKWQAGTNGSYPVLVKKP